MSKSTFSASELNIHLKKSSIPHHKKLTSQNFLRLNF